MMNWKNKKLMITDEQAIVFNELSSKDVSITDVSTLSGMLIVKMKPNLLCVVEEDGSMRATTAKKGDE